MKLEGSLDAFSLPDIFQLLSFTKKSGGLHLRRPATHGRVYFREGTVTGATSDDARAALARRLVGSGAVADDALGAAVERSASEGIGIARALLDARAVDEELLRAMASEQAVDAVFDLLRWTEGDFSFSVDEPAPDDIGVQLGVEDLVTEARGRLESWDHACQVIPAPDVVLTVPITVRDDPQMSRAEWALLALVDGRRTVADLVALAGRGDYAVVSALATLVERELLVVRTGDGDEGAHALARRHSILAKLETAPSASADVSSSASAASASGDAPAAPTSPAQAQAQSEAQTQSEAQAHPEAEQRTEAQSQAQSEAEQRTEQRTERREFAPAPAAPSEPDLPPDESLFAGVAGADLSTSTSTVASVLAAAASGGASSTPREGKDDGGSARLVADTRAPVIPPRPEPFMPPRRPDFPEEAPPRAMGAMGGGMGGSVVGSAAVATDPAHAPEVSESAEGRLHIERDPSVNKSLLLRLIAGVRGL